MNLRLTLGLLLLPACSTALGIEDAVRDRGAPAPAPTTEDAGAPLCAPSKDDPKNCGRCGHDCLGGACKEGRCEAAVVVPVALVVTGMAASKSHLAWSSGTETSIAICELPACQDRRLVPQATRPKMIGDTLVFASPSSLGGAAVESCPASMCPSERVTVTDGSPGAWAGLSGSDLLFSKSGSLLSCTWPACDDLRAIAPIPTAMAGNRRLIGSDATSFYVHDTPAAGGGSLHSCPRAGCVDGQLGPAIANTSGVRSAAAFDGRLAWKDAGVVRTCRADNCAATSVDLFTCEGCSALVLDDKDLFTWDTAKWKLLRCSLEGCSGRPDEIFSGVVGTIEPTSDAVYFTSGYDEDYKSQNIWRWVR